MLSAFLTRLRAHWVPPQEIRAEAWALGGRHRGDVLKGARAELAAPGITLRRAVLLKAVIRNAKDGF
jgi:hypothetical protein